MKIESTKKPESNAKIVRTLNASELAQVRGGDGDMRKGSTGTSAVESLITVGAPSGV
jgi:hypothetical protein